jgi:tetratricopeptide (TPR) repeat protein
VLKEFAQIARLSRRAGVRLSLFLLITGAATFGAAEKSNTRHLTVYLDRPEPSDPGFSVKAGGVDLKVVSSERLKSSRPLLFVLDPNSYGRVEMRRRVAALGAALVASTPLKNGLPTVLVGFPVLDGILTEPISDRETLLQILDKAIESYVPERPDEEQTNPGRTIDLMADMVKRVEKVHGPVDCLIVARDRRFVGDESAYLTSGIERQFLEVSSALGSTFHGYLDGTGVLQAACHASGGLAFKEDQAPAMVIRQILDGRSRGFLLKVDGVAGLLLGGRRELKVFRKAADRQHPVSQSPGALWLNPDGSSAPDHHRMRQGLDWIRRAKDAETDENFVSAQRFLDSSIQEDSWNPEAFYLAGRVASKTGELPVAASHLSRAIPLGVPDDRTLALYVAVFRKMGKAQQALDTIQTSLRAGVPNTPAVKLQTARLLSALKRNEEARAIYTQILNAEQDTDTTRAEYGQVLLDLGAGPAASEQFQAALAKNPTNTAALIYFSNLAASQGKAQEAMEMAVRAVQAQPKSADTHTHLGNLHASAQNWDEAVESYRSALRLTPNNPGLIDSLVEVFKRSSREQDALEVLQRSLEAEPSDAGAHRRLADLQAATGEIAEAVFTLERGAAIVSKDAHTLYREAAELRERRGEYGQALLDYRAMLKAAPQDQAGPVEKAFAQHLGFLSLLVNNGKDLSQLPLPPASSLGSTFSRIVQRQETAKKALEEASKKPGLKIPGGVTVLARTIGVEPAILKHPDALERLLSFMLEVSPQHSQRIQDNPLRRDLIAYLRGYDALLSHMKKKGLLPGDFDPRKGVTLAYPLIGSRDELKNSQQFLKFFGIDLKFKRTKDGQDNVTFTLKQNRGTEARQQLLRNLGVNLLEKNQREFRLTLRDDELPMLFEPLTWSNNILKGEKAKSPYLLGQLVLNPRAMGLYLALASCSDATREALLKATAPGELLQMSEPLALYGRSLDFKNGKLVLPGVTGPWEALVGAPHTDPARFLSALIRRNDQNRTLLLYYGLSSASKPVQQYFTASSERLQKLYQMLSLYDSTRSARGVASLGGQDFGRILRRLAVDEQGLLVKVEERSRKEPPNSGTSTARATRLDLNSLSQMMDVRPTASATQPLSGIEVAELIHHIQSARSESLGEAGIKAIMRDSNQSPVMLDLIIDISPPPALLIKYLDFSRELAAGGARGWNLNRTRSCQSLFHLLSLLRRQGTLNKEEGHKLLASALERLSAADEGTFAQSLADFLSNHLFPVLEKALPQQKESPELLLEALAGPEQIREFALDGRRLQLNASSYKLHRMKGALQQQRYNPLADILAVYGLLAQLKSGKEQSIEPLKTALQKIQTAEFPPNTAGAVKQATAFIDIEALRQRVATSKGKVQAAQLASEVGGILHTELGVTLLSYCYAYYGTPETDALAFDVNFVRKHDFYGQSLPKEVGWISARLEQKEGVGAYCLGSLSGLGFELGRLETAQSVQSFGKREGRSLVPTILSGIRVVPRALRSERAQEYVALAVRLGREILATAVLDPIISAWSETFLSQISPRRREQVMRFVNDGSPRDAGDLLAPSELVLLGESYLATPKLQAASAPQVIPASQSAAGEIEGSASSGPVNLGAQEAPERAAPQGQNGEGAIPELGSPVLARLREIVEAHDDAEFRHEVEQYGVLLYKTLGISQLCLSIRDSYEQLERQAREELLYERICDLKIRVAELNYSLGLPAYLGEVEGELAIRDILPQTAEVHTNSWKLVLEQIGRLETEHARNWVEELLNRGVLRLSSKGSEGK